MSKLNIKARVQTLIEIELEKYQNGEISFGVGNQFNETILSEALKDFDKNFDDAFEAFKDANLDAISVLNWATKISEWEAPELDYSNYD